MNVVLVVMLLVLMLTFDRSFVVAEVEFVNSALSRNILDRHRSIFIRLNGWKRKTSGWHRRRPVMLRMLLLLSPLLSN